jgi:AcrR family transcriptional regulator
MQEAKKNKILTAALSVFLRYGYRRVNMNDIAEATGISRPALYVLFKNKEEIFAGVILQWVDGAVAEIEQEMAKVATSEEKIKCAFEIWSVRPFQLTMGSKEAKEIVDCSFEFAQAALRQGYKKFEATIAPLVALLSEEQRVNGYLSPERAAHVLASAVRGFKQTATTGDEMRQLIHELLFLSLDLELTNTKALKALRSKAKKDKPA